MAISMTGFGSAELQWQSWSCQVEIRSVNQRFLDIRCRLPLGFQKLESEIKKQIKIICSRGKIDCYIRLEKSNESEGLNLNHERAKKYSDLLREFEILSGKNVIIDARSLATVNIIEENANDYNSKDCEKLIFKTILIALDDIKKMKINEGQVMKKDIINRLSICKKILKSIEKLSTAGPESQRKRLQDRFLNIDLATAISSERLEQEIVLFADKLDISEELLRFRTHLKHMDAILTQNEIGKKAEFLIQELNREVNTISSKSCNAQISQDSVEIKSELEKIREQLLNIE
tara:strand:+ start:5002 stop:5871 length:870 start_codon:yes stop_codon:yes gene_type:complete